MDHLYKCTHEENRKKVCAPCGKKIIFGKEKPTKYLINEKHEQLIRTFHNPDFSLQDLRFPIAICKTCRQTHLEHDKNIFTRPMQKMPNYAVMSLPKATRNNSSCDCYICRTGRQQGRPKIDVGRGHVRDLSIQIDDTNGTHGISDSNVKSLPEKRDKKHCESSFKVCAICIKKIGRGISHNCGTTVNARKNVEKLFEKLPMEQQEQIISSALKRKISEGQEVSKNKNSVRLQNINCSLSTEGLKMNIVLNPKPTPKDSLSIGSLDNLQTNLGLSDNKMKKVLNFLRCNVGRKSVPPLYEKHMSANSKIMEHLYKEAVLEFDVEKANAKEKRPIVYADAAELLDFGIQERKFVGHVKVKVMADGGQGFFKISMSVFPEKYENLNADSKKRSLYSEGGTTSEKNTLTSVNRLFILCVVPQIKETYENMKLLFDLIKLNNIPFKFAADFELLLIINGQQTATASYPCPYCFVSLNELRNKNNEEKSVRSEISTMLKTYGHLKQDYDKYCSMGADKKVAKQCNSTINPPLFIENDDVCVLEKCVIPELHILQGFVNHLFWDGLVKDLGREKALLWPEKLKLVPKNYQGEIFEGNACRTLLKKVGELNDPEIYGDLGLVGITRYISAFQVMDKIVSRYFGSKEINTDIDSDIHDLRKAFEGTELSKTLKIHVVLEHLAACLELLNGGGLGLWSEQAGEAIHRNFLDKHWSKFKMNKITDDSYIKKLKRAVVDFSSKHI